MNVQICKWYNNADSPVLFFVDDFANVWIDTNGNGNVELGEDWGYDQNNKNSSFRYLNNIILKNFKQVRTTFFTPVGVRVGMIKNPKIRSISKMINCDMKTKRFFKSINDNYRYEIAYHGTTHGRVGKTNLDFKQEWELFENIDQAVNQIETGKNIYKDVFGKYPKGGKYCGYVSNEFSDESIDKTGFIWWSRYWNRGVYEKSSINISGGDVDPLTNFDIKLFGKNNVVDIPSTINGDLLSGVLNPNLNTIKGNIKRILKNYLIKRRLKEIDFLLKNNLVISIQEHMSPARDDGKRQTPNIFDDTKSLCYIFDYLKSKNVWYCTGSELAEYVISRENLKINFINENTFRLNNIRKNHIEISLKMPMNVNYIKIPNSQNIYVNKGIATIPVLDGVYRLG
ncbi:hypothetical protein [Clostridium novyi]